MTGPLYRVGWFCTRHHWPVIAVWVLAVVALALGARAAGQQNSDNLSLPGTGSTNAQDLLKSKLPNILTYLKHRITNAASESMNAKIQWVKYTARGFRNKTNFKTAIYFHCAGLDLIPGSATH